MGNNYNESDYANSTNLLWLLKNQPPIMHWWFALSAISIMAVSFVLFAKL